MKINQLQFDCKFKKSFESKKYIILKPNSSFIYSIQF